jgi:hypothetical protein
MLVDGPLILAFYSLDVPLKVPMDEIFVVSF